MFEEGIESVCVEVEGLRVTMARAPYCTVLVETLQWPWTTTPHTTPHHTSPIRSSPVHSMPLCAIACFNLCDPMPCVTPSPPLMLSLILSLSNSHTLSLPVWLTLSIPFLLLSSLWLTRSHCLSLFISNRPLFLCLSFSPSFPLSCLPHSDGKLYLIACILLINGFKIPFCDPVQAL